MSDQKAKGVGEGSVLEAFWRRSERTEGPVEVVISIQGTSAMGFSAACLLNSSKYWANVSGLGN